MAYYDDDEKKKSSGSKSASESASQTRSESSGAYARNMPTNTPTKSASEAIARASKAGTTKTTGANAFTPYTVTITGSNVTGAWDPGGTSGTRYRGGGTRSSSNYNRQQQQQQQQPTQSSPANATQALTTPKGTQYGIQGITGLNQRPDIRSQDKWYAGDRPTDIEAMARIMAFDGSEDMQKKLLNDRYDPKSDFYRPSAGITNEAVYHLHELGVNIPAGGLTDEWFAETIPKVTPYYNPAIDSTTGAPKKPKKNAPIEEKIAYWTYQAYNDQANTTKALNEKAALKEEIAYLAGSSSNYSDDEIISRIDWTKYPTLQKIDNDARDGVPMMLNADIDYSRDYLGGMIWAARNGGGTGNSFYDSVNALLGNGQFWQPDENMY